MLRPQQKPLDKNYDETTRGQYLYPPRVDLLHTLSLEFRAKRKLQ